MLGWSGSLQLLLLLLLFLPPQRHAAVFAARQVSYAQIPSRLLQNVRPCSLAL
jgi:hypothetical protein